MYRKIALIFFVLAFLVVIVGGYYFFVKKNNSFKLFGKDSATSEESQEKNSQQIQTEQSEVDLEKQQAEMILELKKKIKENMIAKDALIRSTGSGRPYTQDEVEFTLNPRQNIINEMKTKGEITDEQIKLLLETK